VRRGARRAAACRAKVARTASVELTWSPARPARRPRRQTLAKQRFELEDKTAAEERWRDRHAASEAQRLTAERELERSVAAYSTPAGRSSRP
jgi:hypothetical protein